MAIKVLDHGFVRLVEVYGGGDAKVGNECGIIEAARQSTQGTFRGWAKDEHLLHYLYNNKHSTPFEFAGMVLEIKAPIFVFREWHRHRTQSYNEMSARYAPLPSEHYFPTVERLMLNASGGNKQAGAVPGAPDLSKADAEMFLALQKQAAAASSLVYGTALEKGVPKELARLVLPVSRYSQMRAAANLRNWLAFLTLRQAPEAQWEIRQYANTVAEIIEEQFPRTYECFAGEVQLP